MRTPARPHNILLITLDTTRADRLGCYGYAKAHTPVLDGLATESILFQQAQSVCPLTAPTHASVLTGLDPYLHGVRDNGTFLLGDSVETAAEWFRARGYQTAASVATLVLDERFGFGQGFDAFFAPQAGSRNDGLTVQIPAPEVNAPAVEWLAQRDPERPFFLWVHYYDPHQPLEAPVRFREFVDHPYDGEIAFMDESLGTLLEAVAPAHEADELITIVVGDHGESFGFRGEPTHALLTYEPTLRVPFLLRMPNALGAGTERAEPVSVTDVLPTLCAAVGADASPHWNGANLLDAASLPHERAVYFESYYPWFQHGWSPTTGLVQELDGVLYKYLHSSKPELYRLADGEQPDADLIASEPEVAERLRQTLDALVHARPLPEPNIVGASAGLMESLRRMGYLSAGVVDVPDPLAPPPGARSTGEIPERIREFYRWTTPGPGWTLGRAIEGLRAYVVEEPENVAALDALARYLVQARRYPEAEAPLVQLLELRPAHAVALANLGAVKQAAAEYEEAIDYYTTALQIDPNTVSVLQNLVVVLRHLGREAEADEYEEHLRTLRGSDGG